MTRIRHSFGIYLISNKISKKEFEQFQKFGKECEFHGFKLNRRKAKM